MITALSESPVVKPVVGSWPPLPYKGLDYYNHRDWMLFAERSAETVACGELLGNCGTKLLLVHGPTGTGKSSFLRAGLFPSYIAGQPHFCYLTEPDGEEPLLVRSTADPVRQLADQLGSRLGDARQLAWVSGPTRKNAIALLRSVCAPSGAVRFEPLRDALRLLTSRLPGTLLLVIDQAEEVFTLSGGAASAEARRAFFDFLEDLCVSSFDIKVIVCLRTEYHGQFTDQFRIGPGSKLSRIRAGLEQFMLNGIREPERLKAAIVRPTLREAVGALGAPYKKYGFEYEDGLADRIAADVLEHCGEASTLPVVQLVCSDLYQSQIVEAQLSRITAAAYAARGEVEGAIDRYIQKSIATSVQNARGVEPEAGEVESWQNNVLPALVARQEGGALTSLLVPEEDLVRNAKNIEAPAECLRRMADASVRLLRCVSVRDPAGDRVVPHYSLRHDSLAPALFRSSKDHRKIAELQERSLLYGRGAIALAIIAGIILAAGIVTSYFSELRNIQWVLSYADLEPVASKRLSALVGSLNGATWPVRIFGARKLQSVDSKLRDTLDRMPIQEFNAYAGAYSGDGNRLALILERQPQLGSVYVDDLRESDAGKDPAPRYQFKLPEIAAPFTLTIGFLPKLEDPVLFSERQLIFGEGGTQSGPIDSFTTALPQDGSVPFPEILGGSVRLTVWGGTPLQFKFFDLGYTSADGSGTFEPLALGYVSALSRPVFSDATNAVAYMNHENTGRADWEIAIATRQDAKPRRVIKASDVAADKRGSNDDSARATGAEARDKQREATERLTFTKQLAFIGATGDIVFREKPDVFLVLPDGGPPQRFDAVGIPESELQTVKPVWALQRPALTAARIPGGYRIAWLTETGVVIADAKADGTITSLYDRRPALPSLPSLEGNVRLKLSDDGRFLSLIQVKSNRTAVRVWDLSQKRHDQIAKLSRQQLVAKACERARNPTGGPSTEPSIPAKLLQRIKLRDPCEGA